MVLLQIDSTCTICIEAYKQLWSAVTFGSVPLFYLWNLGTLDCIFNLHVSLTCSFEPLSSRFRCVDLWFLLEEVKVDFTLNRCNLYNLYRSIQTIMVCSDLWFGTSILLVELGHAGLHFQPPCEAK